MLVSQTPALTVKARKPLCSKSHLIGPRLPVPDADSTDWWGRNGKVKKLVDLPNVRKLEDRFIDAFSKQPKGAVLDDVKQVAIKLYEGINTPLSLQLKAALLAGDYKTIAACKIDPRDYTRVDAYYLDMCASSFLRKFEDLASLCGSSETDLEETTKAEFYRAEAECRSTNHRLSLFANGRISPPTQNVELIIRHAKRIIADLLGPVPGVDALELRFGPGATSCCAGDSVTIADKLVAPPTLTWDSLPYLEAVKSSRVWLDLIRTAHPGMVYNLRLVTDDYGNEIFLGCDIAPKLVPGNRFTCVPKDATIHRGICVEPHTLSALQLATGTLLTARLARAGIVKEVQQQVNRRFAWLGSLFDGPWATVDLKAASDTIAYELVKLLLPWDWFDFLASLRSGSTWIDDRWVELEKFSSMGNGFTFELETLIFYALARAVSDLTEGKNVRPVCTYGDDIIISSSSYATLAEVLDFCGFTVNRTKSFESGPFRESCGGDYFNGHAVRPYFLKEAPSNASDWFGVCNGIDRMCDILTLLGLPDSLRGAWLRSLNHVPRSSRLFGPKGFGDDWIGTREEHAGWRTTVKGGVKYLLGRSAVPRYRRLERFCNETQYAAILYGGAGARLPLRGEPDFVTVAWYAIP